MTDVNRAGLNKISEYLEGILKSGDSRLLMSSFVQTNLLPHYDSTKHQAIQRVYRIVLAELYKRQSHHVWR